MYENKNSNYLQQPLNWEHTPWDSGVKVQHNDDLNIH